MWTRRRSRDGDDESWTIYRYGVPVGVVHPVHTGGAVWSWATWDYPAGQGFAYSLDDALEALRGSIRSRWPDDVVSIRLGSGGWT